MGTCTYTTSHPMELHVCDTALKPSEGCAETQKCSAKGEALVQKMGWWGSGLGHPLIVDDMEDDNVNIDLGYTNDHVSSL